MSGENAYDVDVRGLDEFSARDLYALLKLRVDVFVVEQECPYPELDGKDALALHLRLLDGGVVIAAARLFAPDELNGEARIGRVVVAPTHRGKRLGEAVMSEALTVCETRFPGHPIALAAQSHLQKFYLSFGFEVVSDEYLEDDIPHVDMLRHAPGQPKAN